MGEQHLARCAALVEQLPQGLICRGAKALQQGLAQIQPGALAQIQQGLEILATLLQPQQGPGCGGAPDMNKWLLPPPGVQRLVACSRRCLSCGLANGFEQGPPFRGLWCGLRWRIQRPGRAGERQTIPFETLLKVPRVVRCHQLPPALQDAGGLGRLAASSTTLHRL